MRHAVSKNEFLFMPAKCDSRGYRGSDTLTKFYHVVFSSEQPIELPNHFSVKDTSDIRAIYTMLTSITKKMIMTVR